MDKSATINDVRKPIDKDRKSPDLKVSALFIKSKVAAAPIVGTAKRKENSVASFRFSPTKSPPTILAAALDTPGIMDID